MSKFRKKPVVIEAWIWDESIETFNKTGCKSLCWNGHRDYPDLMHSLGIETLEGNMLVSKGDYIIKGVKGEFYPCKPDIFHLTYDAVDGGDV
jgi:hypothetical protein